MYHSLFAFVGVAVVLVLLLLLLLLLLLRLSVYLSSCLSIYLSSCNLQAWKPNYSARLLQFLNLTRSKTKQVCETSSIFELGSIKNETILRDFLSFRSWQHQKRSNSARLWKVECRAYGLVPMRFAIFPFHLSKALHLPRKSNAKSYEVLHLSGKITSANLKIWCSKMQPLSGNQRLWWTCLLYCARHGKCIFADLRQMSHACHRFWKC